MHEMTNFPYGKKRKASNPMHEKMLLLKMTTPIFPKYVFGYYDAVNDIFQICQSPFQDTEENTYQKRNAGRYQGEPIDCMMPGQFLKSIGPRRLISFLTVEEALEDMYKKDLIQENISELLDKATDKGQYLVCLDRNKLILSEIGHFESGTAFEAISMVTVTGGSYHMNSAIPHERIRFAVSLRKWQKTKSPLLENQAVDEAYLHDWYQHSVTNDPPIWTDKHIRELIGDFYLIPRRKSS